MAPPPKPGCLLQCVHLLAALSVESHFAEPDVVLGERIADKPRIGLLDPEAAARP